MKNKSERTELEELCADPSWDMVAALKELYKDDLIGRLLYRDNPFIKLIKKEEVENEEE